MLLGVAGKPIAHSASPLLHSAGLKFNQLDGASFRVIADSAEELLRLCKKIGLRGCNITAPFKQQIAEMLGDLSPEAQQLQAVNTVVFEDEITRGYNTDIYGIEKSLEKLLQKAVVTKAVVLGAGGAAKAVCYVLREWKIDFVIINRSLQKAQLLAQQFGSVAFSFEDPTHAQEISSATLLVNCLSTTQAPFDLNLLNATQYLLDAHYKAASQIAIKLKQLGAKVLDGCEWLLLQSLKSQTLFFKHAPDLEILREALQTGRKLEDLQSFALIGLMGSGKTNTALLLAQELGIKFVDLDAEIEKDTGKKITQIFSELGKAKFRELEADSLNRILANAEPLVLSCGGGIVLNQKNREELIKKCKVFWLWASPDVLSKRLADVQDRPLLRLNLLASNERDPALALQDKLNHLFNQRKQLYAQSADFVIDTDKRSVQQVAKRIYDEIC